MQEFKNPGDRQKLGVHGGEYIRKVPGLQIILDKGWNGMIQVETWKDKAGQGERKMNDMNLTQALAGLAVLCWALVGLGLLVRLIDRHFGKENPK